MTNATAPQKPEPTPAALPKKSRLEIAKEKAAKANALFQKLEAQAKKKQVKEERNLDTRRKVLLGAYLMTQIKKDDELKTQVLGGLDKYLWRDAERALFDLPPLPKPEPSAEAAAGEAIQEQSLALTASTGANAPAALSGV